MILLPTNQEEFRLIMEQIDTQLQAENIPIHVRALRAVGEYAKLFALEIPMCLCPLSGAPGIYTGADAAAHIHNWFNARYGNRQKIFMGPGTTVIILRGDPWEVRIPLTIGSVNYVVEPDLSHYANDPKWRTDGKLPIINLLTLINDFPPGLAAELSDEECQTIIDEFRQSLDCMYAIKYIEGNPYVNEALSDIRAAVQHIFSVPPHYGQSKWSSAQAAEKFLKSFLKIKQIKFPYSHDIPSLADLAATAGMKPIERVIIDQLQTRAAVRYGDETISLTVAVAAHRASLAVGKHTSGTRGPA